MGEQQAGPRKYATLADLGRAWGVSRAALSERHRGGRFPAPDVMVGATPGWDMARAQQWWDDQPHRPDNGPGRPPRA